MAVRTNSGTSDTNHRVQSIMNNETPYNETTRACGWTEARQPALSCRPEPEKSRISLRARITIRPLHKFSDNIMRLGVRAAYCFLCCSSLSPDCSVFVPTRGPVIPVVAGGSLAGKLSPPPCRCGSFFSFIPSSFVQALQRAHYSWVTRCTEP